MTDVNEQKALAQLQRLKASYQSFIKINFEGAADDCSTCTTIGQCCLDEHFVNVQITRLEAVAIAETIGRTPRLTDPEKRAVYTRARSAVTKYRLYAAADTFSQTYSCPLYVSGVGCLVHKRAKPSACIQHACYEQWQDIPPLKLQTRTDHRVEQLNRKVYGSAWAWLPTPLWITLVDPESDGRELNRLIRDWMARDSKDSRRDLSKSERN